MQQSDQRLGVLTAIAAYLLWGVLPYIGNSSTPFPLEKC